MYTEKEISLLKTARGNVSIAMGTGNKMDLGLTVEAIVSLGFHVLLLFVSDEVFEKSIKE